MNYVIIDLEFNNLKNINKYYPETQFVDDTLNRICPNEIIEIGVVKLDKNLKMIDSFNTYVKPLIYNVLNPKVKELTGINEEDLEEGIPFIDAMDLLGAFMDDDSILCSWAKDDSIELIRNCDYHNYSNVTWLKEYIDLQEYCSNILAEKNRLSLKNALKRFNIKFVEDKLHNALNDASYTAEVMRRSFNFKAIQRYIKRDVYEMPVILATDFEALNLEDNNLKLDCPICSSEVQIEFPYEPVKWKFINTGHCGVCDTKLLQEVLVKKNFKGDKFYESKRKILTNDEYLEMQAILSKTS